MKKLSISIFLIVLALTTTVNAATITANPTTVKSGNNVTVSINTSKAVHSMEFTLAYDSDKFDYISNSTGNVAVLNTTTSGKIILSYAPENSTNSISFNFKAKVAGTAEFVISESSFFDNEGNPIESEVFSDPNVTVIVQTENNENNTTNNTNTVEELPQTGSNWTIYIVVILAVGLILGYNFSKRK